MSEDVVIRRAERDDIEDTVTLWVRFSEFIALQEGRPLYKAKARDIFREYLLQQCGREEHLLLVAEVGGEIVGFAEGSIQDPHPMFEQDRYVELYHFYVRQAYRLMGIGRKLLDTFEDWARSHSIRRLHLTLRSTNEIGLRFSSRVGFSDHAIVMDKELDGGLPPPPPGIDLLPG